MLRAPAARPALGRWLRGWRTRWPAGLLWLLVVGTFVGYAVFALARHSAFGTAGYDLGIFDQAVRGYADFSAPIVPLKGVGYNVFGDHFHPIIATAAPFYWIWNHPQTLLVLQAALVASSVPVIYRFARRRTTEVGSLVIAFAYASSWALQTLVNFNVHEVAWGVPILALAIDALDREDDRQLLMFAGLLLLVREDMGVLVLLIGVLRLLRRPRRIGVVLVVAGVLAYELTTAVILPHFAPGGRFAYWQYTETLGPDLPAALRTLVTRPWHVVELFFSPGVKTETLLLLLVPLLLLPLGSPYALLALPLLAQRFFEPSARDNLWYPAYHYNALPWVVLVLAMIDGAGRLGVWRRRRVRAAVLVALGAIPVLMLVIDPRIAGRQVVAVRTLFTGHAADRSALTRAQDAVVAQIPRNTCIEADDRIAGHLTDRNYVTLPPMQHHTADYVVLDLSQVDVGNFGPAPGSVLIEAQAAGYTPVFTQASVVLLRSPHYAGPSAQCGPLGSGHPGAAG